MANGTLLVERSPETGIADARPRPLTRADGAAFDWLMAACGTWLIGGLYLDGWAHIHIPALESFFTPWHAVLYSGYIAGAVALAVTLRRNRRRGASRWDALPAGYIYAGEPAFHAQMGNHLFRPKVLEQPFTSVMIAGWNAGRLHFLEPMVTQEHLVARKDFAVEVPPRPKAFEGTHYPSYARATYDPRADAYHIVFGGFTQTPSLD